MIMDYSKARSFLIVLFPNVPGSPPVCVPNIDKHVARGNVNILLRRKDTSYFGSLLRVEDDIRQNKKLVDMQCKQENSKTETLQAIEAKNGATSQ